MASRDESGISVYPPLPVPRRDEPRQRPVPAPRRTRGRWAIATVAISALAGGVAAWFVQPMIAPDARISAASGRASEAERAAIAQKDRADALEKSFDAASKARRSAEARLAAAETAQSELAGRTAAEASQRDAAERVKAKLKAALDRNADAIAIEGAEVHVRIADRALFRPGDDALTDRGKLVLGKLAAALKQLPDQVIRVQGHTDDQPIALPRPAAVPAPAPSKKPGKPVVVAPPVAVVRFATNWELSAARALAAVHYLQDTAKLEPTRLSALAFGQYAPVSPSDRAANRRLEIVLVARPLPTR
jgi:chemotaxis protein MotB